MSAAVITRPYTGIDGGQLRRVNASVIVAAALLVATVTLAPLVGTTLDDGRSSASTIAPAATPLPPPLRARPLPQARSVHSTRPLAVAQPVAAAATPNLAAPARRLVRRAHTVRVPVVTDSHMNASPKAPVKAVVDPFAGATVVEDTVGAPGDTPAQYDPTVQDSWGGTPALDGTDPSDTGAIVDDNVGGAQMPTLAADDTVETVDDNVGGADPVLGAARPALGRRGTAFFWLSRRALRNLYVVRRLKPRSAGKVLRT